MSRRWQPHTLRFRLALWYAVGGVVLLAAYSASLYLFIAHRLPLEYDLRQDLAVIRAHLSIRADGSVDWGGRPIGPSDRRGSDKPWFELWNERGQLVVRRWPFAEHPLDYPSRAPLPGNEVIAVYRVSSNLLLRVLSLPFPGPRGRAWMLRVMRIHEPATDVLAVFRLILSSMLPVVVALLVAGGYVFTRYWLRPFDRMVAEADRIGVDDLSRRLTVPDPLDEIGHVATAFNVTLDRLEDAFVALDRFVADASHELRTPLTALRSVGELGLARNRTGEEYREIIGSMLEETERLQRLIRRLLELAGAEGGAERAQCRPVRLDREIITCLEDLSVLAENRRQKLTFSGESCVADTDPVIFRQALQNLVENAIKYSPEGSAIAVALTISAGQCSVAVSDEGPGIDVPDQVHITRRFFRADSSRERPSGGFGLGLAITKAYLRMLGGTLGYEGRLPHGSIFHLRLPLQAPGSRTP